MGRIYQRGDRYFIAYNFAGKEYRESSGSSDIREAQRLLDTRLRAVRTAHVAPADRGVTFSHVAALLVDDYTLRGLRTLDTLRGRLVNLTAFFGETPARCPASGAPAGCSRRRAGPPRWRT